MASAIHVNEYKIQLPYYLVFPLFEAVGNAVKSGDYPVLVFADGDKSMSVLLTPTTHLSAVADFGEAAADGVEVNLPKEVGSKTNFAAILDGYLDESSDAWTMIMNTNLGDEVKNLRTDGA